MRIYKEFGFEAAHHLPSAPPGHPNARIHGHSFRCRVTLAGRPDPATGLVMHFDAIDEAVSQVRRTLDHQLLNDVAGLADPTLERLTLWIWRALHNALPGLHQVHVFRPSCGEGCIYEGGDD